MIRRRQDDRGAALLVVIGLGFVMITLIATGLTIATSGLRQAATGEDAISAADAAYAGVQDYLARVNNDPTYVKYANPASTFGDRNDTLPTGSDANAAFNVAPGDATTWVPVPGSGANARFRYEVDNSTYTSTGIIRLRSTGAAGDRTKTLVTTLRVRGFVDYSYFTDYEIQDPILSGASAACNSHAWETRPTSGCFELQFGSGDVVSGDVHSNDTIRVCGARFLGNVTTANTRTPLYTTPSGCAAATISITRAASLPMPSTNTAMKDEAACLYTGPTRITYRGDGTMNVVSPWTKFTDVSGTAPANPAECGSLAALHSTGGATVAQLDADLLYVQKVQTDSADPNYWSTTTRPSGLTCLGGDGTSTTAADGAGWTHTGSGVTVRYPLSNESPATYFANSADTSQWNTGSPAYGCRSGDLFVRGTVTEATTAASDNFVYVIGDIVYGTKGEDVLGLVGQNSVIVWNPMNRSDSPILTDSGREIDAAIASVLHTFQVQNYDRGGTRGALYVYGSIAQKYRGPVRATNPDTGYTKSYAYDPLLKTVSPPKFLSPTSTSFSVVRYASVPIAFDATGAQR